jgi:hypothetical protein
MSKLLAMTLSISIATLPQAVLLFGPMTTNSTCIPSMAVFPTPSIVPRMFRAQHSGLATREYWLSGFKTGPLRLGTLLKGRRMHAFKHTVMASPSYGLHLMGDCS